LKSPRLLAEKSEPRSAAAGSIANCPEREKPTVESAHAAACELAEEVIRKFGAVRLRVQGTSMTPAIRPGDTISIQRTNPREIAPGEIIMFSRDGQMFAHRVIKRIHAENGMQFLTQGDRMQHPDPAVRAEEFLGRVVLIERGKRRIAPSSRISAAGRTLGGILRNSEKATALYLRVVSS
jgi:signal peptidase I